MGWISDAKIFLENLDYHSNPREALEEIVQYVQERPLVDGILKGTKTYNLLLKSEERINRHGIVYAAQLFLKDLEANCQITGQENIPNNGSAIYVANHPYGVIDSLILVGGLGGILEEKGRELKIIGTHLLKMVKGIDKTVLFVDSSGNSFRNTPLKQYHNSIRNALDALHNGGSLATFPSGQISRENLREYPWNNSLGRLARHADSVVPMWFSGPDHCRFYNFIAKKNHDIRNVLSFVEAWNKKGKTITLSIGKPISREEISKLGKEKEEITKHIRQKAEELKYD